MPHGRHGADDWLLLDLDQAGTSNKVDAAWDKEILDRFKAVDDGVSRSERMANRRPLARR